jgi:hypothetical protein
VVAEELDGAEVAEGAKGVLVRLAGAGGQYRQPFWQVAEAEVVRLGPRSGRARGMESPYGRRRVRPMASGKSAAALGSRVQRSQT